MAGHSGGFSEAVYGEERVERGPGGETHQRAGDGRPALTTQQGTVVADDQNSLRIGERGPGTLEDFHFREKIFHFGHERIPERVVHARWLWRAATGSTVPSGSSSGIAQFGRRQRLSGYPHPGLAGAAPPKNAGRHLPLPTPGHPGRASANEPAAPAPEMRTPDDRQVCGRRSPPWPIGTMTTCSCPSCRAGSEQSLRVGNLSPRRAQGWRWRPWQWRTAPGTGRPAVLPGRGGGRCCRGSRCSGNAARPGCG